jgi:hypothetical protein
VETFRVGFMNRPKMSYQQGYKQVINRIFCGIVDKCKTDRSIAAVHSSSAGNLLQRTFPIGAMVCRICGSP